jgi:diacylglycerol kinase (ATP)
MNVDNANRIAVWVNECCAFGKGKKRWKKIAKSGDSRLLSMQAATLRPEDCDAWVQSHIQKGTRRFVAVGGDGTVNVLANALVRSFKEPVCLGAIGTGSSNDFHKPFRNVNSIAGFPCRLDFAKPLRADLIRIRDLTMQIERYALINASVGLTADANHYFNHPDAILRQLKSVSSQLAIFYAALRTLCVYQTRSVEVAVDEHEAQSAVVSNIGIVKNRHFSGSFRYGFGAEPDSGDFYLYLCRNLSRSECLRTLFSLLKGSFRSQAKKSAQRAKSLRLSAQSPLTVELDGEVMRMKEVEIGIEAKRILLCR